MLDLQEMKKEDFIRTVKQKFKLPKRSKIMKICLHTGEEIPDI